MAKPRVIQIKEIKQSKPKKPKVVEERDYSLLLDDDEDTSNVILHRTFEKHRSDAVRDKLREDMLADITPVRPPLSRRDLDEEIGRDQKKRNTLGKKIRKVVGLE